MYREAQASSAADVTDPAIAALHRQLAELTIQKARADVELAQLAEAKAAEKARADAELAQVIARAVAADAELAKEKARADAAEKAVLAEKARSGAAIAVDRAFPKPRPFDNFLKAEASARVLQVDSPTAENGGVLRRELAVFMLDARPQEPSLAALDQTRSLRSLSQSQRDPALLLHERSVYPLMTSFLPKWVHNA